ncbi:glutathione-dependent formaldehyde-activating protein [Alcanivorax hongdengensis A-11-3]|uniref:Glutathione-dependent formaldehyde-activating protein n=1 Tax=Alcanivorax hongdengensis A-11-3 TaxID=1177179 RepID=L0W9Z7_9GAMM|nr:GFA family protein [Alcanivorax hongdengensis]EKF73824.1 glutathione-dependent formaldehyde-activating protein [Alcanivorax hongdengensis A-11-3]
MVTGSCLCGGIAFEIDGELAPIQVCHCQQCRKAQGTALVTNIPVSTDHLRWLRGESLLKGFASSPGKQRVFCQECGSPVLSRKDSLPGVVRIRAGLLNEPLTVRPAFHAYVEDACNWWAIEDDLPRFAQGAK